MSRLRLTPSSLLAGAVVVALAGCSRTDWLKISSASSTDPSSTSLNLTFDACANTQPVVTETDTEIHLRVDLKFNYGGDQKACLGGAVVQLSQPIRTRKVIDDRHHYTVTVAWNPVIPTQTFAGSVKELRGQEGDATLTAWLIVNAKGAATMCDDLPAASTKCPGPTIDVDWTTGGTQPPTNLVTRGGVRVSDGLITLRGSLKADILYVGITP